MVCKARDRETGEVLAIKVLESDIAADVNTPRFTGFWRARAGVRSDSTADSLAIMLDHLRRLCDEPVSAESSITAELNSVSAGEVQAVAQKDFRPDRAHIVAAGDGARVRTALAKYGTVETA